MILELASGTSLKWGSPSQSVRCWDYKQASSRASLAPVESRDP